MTNRDAPRRAPDACCNHPEESAHGWTLDEGIGPVTGCRACFDDGPASDPYGWQHAYTPGTAPVGEGCCEHSAEMHQPQHCNGCCEGRGVSCYHEYGAPSRCRAVIAERDTLREDYEAAEEAIEALRLCIRQLLDEKNYLPASARGNARRVYESTANP